MISKLFTTFPPPFIFKVGFFGGLTEIISDLDYMKCGRAQRGKSAWRWWRRDDGRIKGLAPAVGCEIGEGQEIVRIRKSRC
ncbi:hypothetical protein CcI6DRAFT_03734 [Frankia sp. CcI6]|nr:hypothetical protein CcI6DRAFT_03734 [Frankia sp. CcI6]KFB02505.1 hypothetical protein ALLO2DRAFT_04757 [Frankia sp. Allo2]OHV47165.1 hypothetical protein CgIS1_22300 [Frankia sp. CgIS1]